MSRPAARITVRGGVALVKGWGAQHACRQVGADPRWSDTGRGWVVEARFVPDVVAFVQMGHGFAVVSDESQDKSSGVAS